MSYRNEIWVLKYALKAVENIDANKLKGEEGMNLLFKALDKVFLLDKIQRQFDLYCLLHSMKIVLKKIFMIF